MRGRLQRIAHNRPSDQLTIDRIVFAVLLGLYDRLNRALVCFGCNEGKLHYSLADAFALLDALSQARHDLDANDRMVPVRIPKHPRRTSRDNDAIRSWAQARRVSQLRIQAEAMRLQALKREEPTKRRKTSSAPDYTGDASEVPTVAQLIALMTTRYVGQGRYLDDSGAILPLRLASIDRIDSSLHHVDGNIRLLYTGPNLLRGHVNHDRAISTWLRDLAKSWRSADRQWGGHIPGAGDWEARIDLEAAIAAEDTALDEELARVAADAESAGQDDDAALSPTPSRPSSSSSSPLPPRRRSARSKRPSDDHPSPSPVRLAPLRPLLRPMTDEESRLIFSETIEEALGVGHCGFDALAFALGMVEHDRALVLRTRIWRFLRDNPEGFGWMTAAQRARALETLWPGGVVPERGSEEWEKLLEEGVGVKQQFDALVAAVAAQMLHRRIVTRVGAVGVQVVAPRVEEDEEGEPIGLELVFSQVAGSSHYVAREIVAADQLPEDNTDYDNI